jgi:Uma2 family endonuclease
VDSATALVSEDEYVALAAASEDKLEFFDGKVYAMPRGRPRHNLITANVSAALTTRLRGSACRALSSDQRVYVAATGLFTYADVTVLCGPPELHPRHSDTILNPTVLVEVLSPSTEAYDRVEKFEHYKRIASLMEYVLVSQSEPRVDKLARGAPGAWVLTSYGGEGEPSALPIPCLGCEIPLAEIFEGADALAPPPARAKRLHRLDD